MTNRRKKKKKEWKMDRKGNKIKNPEIWEREINVQEKIAGLKKLIEKLVERKKRNSDEIQ